MQPAIQITELLEAWTGGDRAALDAVMPFVVDELKRIASAYLARERHADTLQTTALVNEAYLRLVRVRPQAWTGRTQFFALTARIMRRILVDHARAQLADHRGGGVPRMPLDPVAGVEPAGAQSLVGLNDALLGLEQMDPRKSQVVELRIFGGLSNEEIGKTLGLSERTVVREWQFAKAWLARELNYEVGDCD